MKVIAYAPTRISLFGGGTDVDPFASKYGGVVINMAINIRQKVVVYTGNDMWELNESTFPHGGSKDFAWKILEELGVDGMHKLRIKSEFLGEIGAGLGSSASFAVTLIGACNKAFDLGLTNLQIAEKAWDIEVNKMGWWGGKQDQWASLLGGVNAMDIGKTVTIVPIAKGFAEPLVEGMTLFYTGDRRESKKLQEGLRELTKEQIETLKLIKELAIGASVYVAKGDIAYVGKLLNTAWQLKKKSNKGVSTQKIDNLYDKALREGAYGGKVLGAGGGGYMLFLIEPERKKKFIEEMEKTGMSEIDFSPDWNGLEARRI